MTKKQIPKEANFIANYLAKFDDSYEQLGFINQSLIHKLVSDLFDIGEDSFRRLRDEYDGFYNNNRKGYPNPEKRKLRVYFKELFDPITKSDYTEKVRLILSKQEISVILEDEKSEIDKVYEEGKLTKIYVNRYERNIKARNKSLEFHNYSCVVCGYKAFENFGKDIFILEVHHIKPLSEIQENYTVNPEIDLKPLCPNCHRAIHTKTPAYTIEELKEIRRKVETK